MTDTTNTDHNALLLQVMAHDLLAPLTAIKWQLELLGREKLAPKGVAYIEALQQSAAFGISLTKHAHVAGKVLVGSYDLNPTSHMLPATLSEAVRSIVPQYERHGVNISLTVDTEESERTFDAELVSVLVWSVAKFLLSCTPAGTHVTVRGIAVPDEQASSYALLFSVSDIPEADDCVSMFNKKEARGSYDHAYVFSKLAHSTSELLGVDVSAAAEGANITIEIGFRSAVD